MTFLPIVGRELLVRARSGANYWGRLVMGAVGVLVCAPPLFWSPFATAADTGRAAFKGLVSAAFLLCCAACLVTADTISAERRQGTLELLQLTRVRDLDLLLGKFASNSLPCLLGLIAFLPILALPILTGGVTGGEAARKAVALLGTLFLALSAGLWASACGLERFRTARMAVVAMALLVLAPSFMGWLLPTTSVGLASPLGALSQAADLAYKSSKARFWVSLALVQIVTWALLFWAAAFLRNGLRVAGGCGLNGRSVDTQASVLPAKTTDSPAATGPSARPTMCRYCGRQNHDQAVYCDGCGTELYPKERHKHAPAKLSSAPTPLHWLLQRHRGLSAMLWCAAIISFFHLAVFRMIGSMFPFRVATGLFGLSWALNLAATAISGSLFAWVASRFFTEARRTGELELLLTTPVGAGQIVSAQWDVLKRMLRGPVLIMLAPLGLQALFMLSFGFGPSPDFWRVYYVHSLLLSGINTVLSVGTLCWLGLWFGLRPGVQGRAILWTVLLTYGFPYLLGFGCSLLTSTFAAGLPGGRSSWLSWPWVVGSLGPQLATLLFYLWLIRLARWHLLHALEGAEPVAPSKFFSGALARVLFAIRRARQWPIL